MACTRAMVALFANTSSADRTANTALPIVSLVSWIPRSELGSLDTYVPIRWHDWVTRVTLYGLNDLRADADPILAFSSTCLSALLIQRAIADIASRMSRNEVMFETPHSWDVRDLLHASQDVHKHSLFELFVAMTLWRATSQASDEPSGRLSIEYDPGLYTWTARSISVTFRPTESPRDASLDTGDGLSLMSAAKLRHEATLLALHMLLEHVYKSEVPPTRSHADFLLRTVRGLVKDASASNASAAMQREFLELLSGIYESRAQSTSRENGDRNHGLDSESHLDSIGAQNASGPEAPLLSVAGHSLDTQPHTYEPAARILLGADEVIDLIVPFVETMDSSECSNLVAAIRTLLRPPRHRRSLTSLISARQDQDEALNT